MSEQRLHHPDAHQPSSEFSENEVLHVAACYSNPFRWKIRRELTNDFRRHMMNTPNVRLHLIELAYGDRPFDVTNPELYPDDIQLRTNHELWHKENLLNIAVSHFPSGWKYGMYSDADFHFTRHDWALETIHQLQHYSFVQPFSHYTALTGETIRGRGHHPSGTAVGFAYTYHKNDCKLPTNVLGHSTGSGKITIPKTDKNKRVIMGSPGGAWAFRHEAFDTVGGLLDKCILGSADVFMAFGMIGIYDEIKRDGGITTSLDNWEEVKYLLEHTQNYRNTVLAWQERAARLKGNIGYVDQFAVHHFHGDMKRRQYSTRDRILIEEKYDPMRDVSYDSQGVLQLNPDKPRLRDRVRKYFLDRVDDLPHIPDDF